MTFIKNILIDVLDLVKKILLNISILHLLFKKQFFNKNKFIFILLPIFLSFIIIKYSLFKELLSKEQISILVTSISLFGGLLLNFLILILGDKGSLLYIEGIKELYGEIKTGKYDDKGDEVIIKINYFELLYYKIFFIIIISIIYLVFFISLQFGFFDKIILYIGNHSLFSLPYIDYIFNIKKIFYFIYIYFLLFYFINVLYLILKLYYLLQRKKGITN